jgi:2-C-methyl-D-erythritol 4-phosphate cytidylyltransferase
VPGLPVVDTVKRVDAEGAIAETLDRSELRTVQTPQAFVADVLRRSSFEGTDCASALEQQGARVLVVEGDPRLLKVTTPDDLALVESWLGDVA